MSANLKLAAGTAPGGDHQLLRIARRLADQEGLSRALQDTADIVVLTQDAKGRLLSVNRYGRWLWGQPARQLRRRTFASLLDDPPATLARQLEDVAAGRVHSLRHESPLARPDGDALLMSWWHTLWQSGAGRKQRIVSIGLDVSDQRIAEAHIGWLASHDPLTGLFNRRRFIEEGRRWLDAAESGESPGFSLLLLDLDQFRDVNDLNGHQQGDRLLQRVSLLLSACLRPTDVIARLGGDEFAILLASNDAEFVLATAKRCCNTLNEQAMKDGSSHLPVTTSIGISHYPQHGRSMETLLANADIAMYQAKAIGRNAWHVFDGDELHRARIQERMLWEKRVRALLAGDSITLHFQPIMHIQSQRISHNEALLRVADDDGGWLDTQELISTAEQGGMIQRLDERIIARGCELLAKQGPPGERPPLAINLSGLSCHNPRLVPHVRHVMQTCGIAPGELIFEITETAALADVHTTIDVMQDLRALGCRFALDDFGVGFSSLYYLKKLPVDFVKIDGSFIRQLDESDEHRVLIRALVDVARAFRLQTVAEFVENDRVLALLNGLGVDYAQGYHIGKPAAPAGGPVPGDVQLSLRRAR
ncbi:EAL domain-containing protein [Alcanivorax sp. JB21]|uniref:putative bifunctional diguanylate cyclase/phosphodiesterase n=1 Tax=Alcanivorax limicola TaxID=2874102 RepID=UPI001CBCDE26|nr:bifunctional diguanylate cyclase/phosphodiesterase [Alcanivorax limicola]MBZ2188622.1 EAL domain-containing protein [Alcanivorax limicola]